MVTITQETNSIHNGKIKLTGSGPSVYADSSPPPVEDLNDREGWLFTKTSGAEKFNYYIYGEGNQALTLSMLKNVFFTGSIDNYISGTSNPFIVVYTKPTGIGDAGAWYHSKVAYVIDNFQNIQIGEICLFRCLEEIEKNPYTFREIPLLGVVKTGDALPSEEILTISIQSDSSAADTTQILIEDVGFEFKRGNHKISRKIKLVV